MQSQPITNEEVSEYMLAKLNECLAMAPGPVQFSAVSHNFGNREKKVEFRGYHESMGHAKDSGTPEGAMENFREMVEAYTPANRAESKRQQAAALMAEAEALDPQSSSL